jgi:hypothetical protein
VKRWVVRHATGKELSTGSYDEKSALKGCEEVYRYYDAGNTLTNAEVLLVKEDPELGDILGRNGKFYGTGDEARLDSTTPVGIVIYRGENADNSWQEGSNGLVMSLKEDNITVSWATEEYIQNKNNDLTQYIKELRNFRQIDEFLDGDLKGYQATSCLTLENNVSVISHTIDSLYNNPAKDMSIPSVGPRISKWFLPTASQIGRSFKILAERPVLVNTAVNSQRSTDYLIMESSTMLLPAWIEEVLKPMFLRVSADGVSFMPKGEYWLSTQMPFDGLSGNAWYFIIKDNFGFSIKNDQKMNKKKLRPILAFKVNGE